MRGCSGGRGVEAPVVGAGCIAMFAAGAASSAAMRFVQLAHSPKGTPEFRNALIISIAMSVAFALSVAGFVMKISFMI